jgi:YegS/Rv2252/BmrU family lipid kinase
MGLSPSTALVIVNPAAGGGRAGRTWERARRALGDLDLPYTCVQTSRPGEATSLARDAVHCGVQRVIAVGGDGTVSAVADGLAGSQTALGVVPAGTGNDFVRTMRLPREAGRAARLALQGASGWIDVGRVEHANQIASLVNVAGCGFDAEVVRRTGTGRTGGGTLPYLASVVRVVWTFAPRRLRLTLDGQSIERHVLGVAVANGPCYGGGLRIAPAASLEDGLLDVCLVGALPPLGLLALLPRLYAGTHAGHPAVEFFRCREVVVESVYDGPETCCHTDGELLGRLPARFWIEPRGLRCVLGPAA